MSAFDLTILQTKLLHDKLKPALSSTVGFGYKRGDKNLRLSNNGTVLGIESRKGIRV